MQKSLYLRLRRLPVRIFAGKRRPVPRARWRNALAGMLSESGCWRSAPQGRNRWQCGWGKLVWTHRLALRRFGRLALALVEIEGGVELRLLREQILQARFLLERAVRRAGHIVV